MLLSAVYGRATCANDDDDDGKDVRLMRTRHQQQAPSRLLFAQLIHRELSGVANQQPNDNDDDDLGGGGKNWAASRCCSMFNHSEKRIRDHARTIHISVAEM